MALVGEEAKGLSSAVVSRLKAHWSDEYGAWMKRDSGMYAGALRVLACGRHLLEVSE